LLGFEDAPPQFLRVELGTQPGVALQDLCNLAPGSALVFITAEELLIKRSAHMKC